MRSIEDLASQLDVTVARARQQRARVSPPLTITTRLGDMAGSRIDTPTGAVRRFAGIPYGRAPIGQERFRAAAPAAAWTGTLDAGGFGPAPMQALSGPFVGAVPGMRVDAVDEDCLSLNVWVPDHTPADAALPVLVWVYGGAFVIGGSSAPTYDGARLAAEQDVIVVSINYRVGPFGFLDLRSVPGGDTTDPNCGIHDIVLALRWVAANIDSFGGDPARITAFGESAGAGSLLHVLTTPNIGDVLSGVIAQSPGVDFTQRAELAGHVAKTFMVNAGVATVDALRKLPATALVEAQVATSGAMLFDVGTMVFHPVVDDVFVTATPSEAIAAGAVDGVALMLGYTADELRLFPDPRGDTIDAATMTRWARTYLTSRSGEDPGEQVAAQLVDSYRRLLQGTARSVGSDTWEAFQTDGIMRQPVIRLAGSRSPQASTFVYQLNWQSHVDGRDAGAFHAMDLPFVFDAFDVDGWGTFIGADERARALGAGMRAAWAAFAATGDPSNDQFGEWPRHEPSERSTMLLDEVPTVTPDPLRAQREWWDGLWDAAGCRPSGVPL